MACRFGRSLTQPTFNDPIPSCGPGKGRVYYYPGVLPACWRTTEKCHGEMVSNFPQAVLWYPLCSEKTKPRWGHAPVSLNSCLHPARSSGEGLTIPYLHPLSAAQEPQSVQKLGDGCLA